MNISLILCTRNRREILIPNLMRFVDQFNEEDEIIIVDSSDKPQKIASEDLGGIKTPIHYYHTLPGLPLQRNYGIEKAKCDLVMFLDDDIYLFSETLNQVRSFFDQHVNADAITGALSEKLLPSYFARVLQYCFGKLFFTSYFGQSSLTPGGLPVISLDSSKSHGAKFLRGGFSVYKRNVFKNIRYDEYFKGYAYLEDTEFSIQFNKLFKAYFFDKFRGFHAHISTVAKDQSDYRKQYVINYAYIYKKHHLGSTFKMKWVLMGLLFLNGMKSCMERNSSYYKGTLEGIRCVNLQIVKHG